MAGKSIESSIRAFENAPPHPTRPLKRYKRDIETPSGNKTIVIIDINREIKSDPDNLKKLGLTPSEESS